MNKIGWTARGLFDEYNKKYFDGKLPKYRVIRCNLRVEGLCDPQRKFIFLNNRRIPDQKTAHKILLHEMCHIGISGHGERFQRRLRALVDRGEQWADEEAERYVAAIAEGRSTNDEVHRVRTLLDDWAFECSRSGRIPSFRQVLKQIGCDTGLSDDALLRRMPWLLQAWKKAKDDASQLKRARA